MIGPSEKSGIEIESEYQLTGYPVYLAQFPKRPEKIRKMNFYVKMSAPFEN